MFYTTPTDARLPHGLTRLCIFHTQTARRLLGVLKAPEADDGYGVRIHTEAN